MKIWKPTQYIKLGLFLVYTFTFVTLLLEKACKFSRTKLQNQPNKNIGDKRLLLIPGTGNGERETGNGKRETGNGKRETGNGEPGTGVWERVHSVNPYKNSKWRTKSRKRVWKLMLSTWSAWTIGLGFIEWFYMILTWALAMGSVSLGCDLCSVNSSLNVTQDSKGPPTIVLPT